MNITEKIKELREKTGVSVMVCKKALEQSQGNMDKALEILGKESARTADKKLGRHLGAGIIDAYIHNNKQLGVLVEVRCETDFVANNREFQDFSHDVAMQIAAANPKDISQLLEQPFIKDPELTINDYLKQAIQKFGENITIEKFSRFEA